jgi:hypothetical protein
MNEQDKEAHKKWYQNYLALYHPSISQAIIQAEHHMEETWEAALTYERENNSPNEAYIKMLQDTVESQKKQVTSDLIQKKAVVEYCYDHLDKMWAAKITGILLGCDFRDAKEHADEFFKYCEEEGV